MFENAEHINEDFYNGPFARADFNRSEFTNCNFYDCDFAKADFLGAIFINCSFDNCNLNAYIPGVRFDSCLFTKCTFDDAYIFHSQFLNCRISKCSMRSTLLATVDFARTTFSEVSWNGTTIGSPPLIIEGIEYPIIALDNGYMHVGCEFNTMDWFYNTDEKHSARMEGLRARRFWKRNKRWIFDMLIARKLYVLPQNR